MSKDLDRTRPIFQYGKRWIVGILIMFVFFSLIFYEVILSTHVTNPLLGSLVALAICVCVSLGRRDYRFYDDGLEIVRGGAVMKSIPYDHIDTVE